MKKYLLICAIVFGVLELSTLPMRATETTLSTSRELPNDAQLITVHKLVHVGRNAWSSSSVSAYYSSSENCIYVNEGKRRNQSYTIFENRAYGQPNDGRAEYRYVAGEYYFNINQ